MFGFYLLKRLISKAQFVAMLIISVFPKVVVFTSLISPVKNEKLILLLTSEWEIRKKLENWSF